MSCLCNDLKRFAYFPRIPFEAYSQVLYFFFENSFLLEIGGGFVPEIMKRNCIIFMTYVYIHTVGSSITIHSLRVPLYLYLCSVPVRVCTLVYYVISNYI